MHIRAAALYGCTSLNAVHCLGTPPTYSKYDDIPRDDIPFDYPYFNESIYDHATLYVPMGSYYLYKKDKPWSDFKNIVEE